MQFYELFKKKFLVGFLCHNVSFMIAGSNPGTSPLFNISSSMPTAPVRKSGADEFLNSENNKNDYDWYVMPCHYPYIWLIIFISMLRLLEKCLMEVLCF